MPIAALALLCATAVPQAEAFWLDLSKLDFESQMTARCLQGISDQEMPPASAGGVVHAY
jgi:hypothetical protein